MKWVPENVERLVPYQPGKPLEELERELGVRDAVKLASNESPVGPSPRVVEAIRQHATEVHRYPDASTHALRDALAAHHGVTASEIVPGNGSNELIDLIARTYAGPADHAVIGAPSFVCYHLALTAANVPFDTVPLTDGLYWDLPAMAAAVRDETRLVFIANPNNPTGTHVGGDALRAFLDEVPPHVLVVLDEAYVHFADADDYVSALALRDRREQLLVLRTFSKAYGLAALRVGYAIGPSELVGYLNRVRAPFNVGSLGQVAARAALEDPEHVARYVELNRTERTKLAAALSDLGLAVAPSQTNFLFVDVARDPRALYDALLRKGVIVRPMPPALGTWMRITVGLPEENERLLAALRDCL